MVRELTKSAFSFSWALSLLTLKQAVNLLTPGKQNGGDLFAPITQVAVGQLDESMKGFYRSGDSFQTRIVDTTFSLINPGTWFNADNWTSLGGLANPSRWINPDSWVRSAANLTQAATGCCAPRGGVNRPPHSPAGVPPTVNTAGSEAPRNANPPLGNGGAAGGVRTANWGPLPTNRS